MFATALASSKWGGPCATVLATVILHVFGPPYCHLSQRFIYLLLCNVTMPRLFMVFFKIPLPSLVLTPSYPLFRVSYITLRRS